MGKNLGGYFGDSIEIDHVLADIHRLAAAAGWETAALTDAPSPAIHSPTLIRRTPKPTFRFYISAGIHGDEPAGPLAVRELLERNEWPDCADLWLCPCLNPTGFPLNKREAASGVDLNRDYRSLRSDEVRAHVLWLDRQPSFDAAFCLHEDWEAHGFYVYELNPDGLPSLAPDIVARASRVCPIDPSTVIDGREARDGIIRPHINLAERPDWPEAFYLLTHKTRLSYTLEAPSDFPLPVRVAALVAATTAALHKACAGTTTTPARSAPHEK
jgi:protein MpaA